MLDLEKAAPSSRQDAICIVFHRQKLVMDMRSQQPCVLSDSDLGANRWDVQREQFVGHWQGAPCFALEIRDDHDVDAMRYQTGTLYHLLGRVDDSLFSLAGRALQLLDWERDHRYCGRCAEPMRAAEGERALSCPRCETLIYPRIAPCVITLVTRGDEMLLASSPRFPRPMYSTLAGFIEAGESAEETLRREVREEVGLTVDNIKYFASQAWPFPSQLMLGYFANYVGGDITPDPTEIADAQWFHPQELPPIPPPSSIAGRLIEAHCHRVLNNQR